MREKKARAPVNSAVEAVEKVNPVRIGRVGRKCNLSGRSVYNDLILERDQETLGNYPIVVVSGFFYGLVRRHWPMAKLEQTRRNSCDSQIWH